MIIADSLRQEAMPEMVFSICRMALLQPKKAQIKRLITLETEGESAALFAKVYQFAVNCGFISEAGDETVSTVFSEEELRSFRRFCAAALHGVFSGQDTAFTIAAKWYMSQKIPQNSVKGQTVFSFSTASHFVQAMPRELNIDENFINGFRYWMAALGLCSFAAPGSAGSARPGLLFAAHRAIGAWLDYSSPFQTEVFVPARAFFGKLISELPVFSRCIDGNMVSSSVSSGLRVLESCGRIELKRITDAGDVWHLSKSNIYQKSNDLTDLVIKETPYVE